MASYMWHGHIEEFSVEKGNWSLWTERLEQYFVANEIKKEKEVPILLTLVGSEGYSLIKDLCTPNAPASKSFEEIKKLMLQHLQPAPNKIAQRYKFKNRKQLDDESVAQYLANLKKLSMFCDFGENLETNLTDQLVWGIKSDNAKRKLLSEENLNYKKAVEIVLSVEASNRDISDLANKVEQVNFIKKKKFHQRTSKASDNGTSKKGSSREVFEATASTSKGKNNVTSNTNRSCFCCGDYNHYARECRFRNGYCYRCGKKGHTGRMCKRNKEHSSTNYVESEGNGSEAEVENTGDFDSLFTMVDEDVRETNVIIDNACLGLDCLFGNSEEIAVVQPYAVDSQTINFNESEGRVKPLTVELKVDTKKITFQVDTGSNITAISNELYQRNFISNKLKVTNEMFKSYVGDPIIPIGIINVLVSDKGRDQSLDLYVVPKGGPPIIGRAWLKALQISINFENNDTEINYNSSDLDSLLAKYDAVFTDRLGLYNKEKLHLEMNDNYKGRPIFVKQRPLAFALKQKVDLELNKLINEGIVEEISYSDWATPIVPILKKDGSIRICGDYKVTINTCLDDDNFPIPRVEEIFAKFCGGQQFTKLDMSMAYQQLELDEESKLLTTISTHRGLFRYNRLPFGVKPAAKKFQKIITKLLGNIENVGVFFDDICITGSNREEHLKTLEQVLLKLKEAGLTLKKEKCSFLRDSVTYLGHRIDCEGIHMASNKVDAIKNAPRPENVSELKAFLGTVNYYAKFISNLSTLLHPLHKLLQKNQKWEWLNSQELAFKEIKRLMMSKKILVHYNPNLELRLNTDASSYGIGGVISHVMENGEERPIAYASRSLSDAEKRYSQLEKEALAIVFSVKKFHQYLFGRKFTLCTDHRSLVTIFNPKKGIPEMTANRIQRWALFLCGYNYDICYVKGIDNMVADGLSRLPSRKGDSNEVDTSYLNYVTDNIPCLTDVDIKKGTERDPILAKTYGYIENGWPSVVDSDELKPYFLRRTELYIDQGCILWGHRVVVPRSMQPKLLDELHIGHMGVVKMKMLSRSYVWWPSLDHDLETLGRSCEACLEEKDFPSKVKINTWLWPTGPNVRLHADFAGPFMSKQFLIITDAYSKWVDIKIMHDITSAKTIDMFREYFATWGIPNKLVTDNGSSFMSSEFQSFLNHNGIVHQTIAPYCPQGNGAAENAVRTFKKKMKVLIKQLPLQQALNNYLFAYRSSPHCTTGLSPAELQLGRKLVTRLDKIKPGNKLRDRVEGKQKLQERNFGGKRKVEWCVGQEVMVRDVINSKWIKACILKRITNDLYLVKTKNDMVWKRHTNQMIDYEPANITDSVIEVESFNQYPNANVNEQVRPNVVCTENDSSVDANAGVEQSMAADAGVTSNTKGNTKEKNIQLDLSNPTGLRRSERIRKPKLMYDV